jgi:hypothetical protein
LKRKDKFVKELGIRYPIFGVNISVDVEGLFNSFNFVGATHVVQVGFSIFILHVNNSTNNQHLENQ